MTPSNANTSGLSVESRAELYDHMKLVAEANGFKSLTEAIARATAAEARADRLATALEPFARVARWARLCGMSDLEKATAKYAKRNLFWDQFSAADAALSGDTDHAG